MAMSREQKEERAKAVKPVVENRDKVVPPAPLASPDGGELSGEQLGQVAGGEALAYCWCLADITFTAHKDNPTPIPIS